MLSPNSTQGHVTRCIPAGVVVQKSPTSICKLLKSYTAFIPLRSTPSHLAEGTGVPDTRITICVSLLCVNLAVCPRALKGCKASLHVRLDKVWVKPLLDSRYMEAGWDSGRGQWILLKAPPEAAATSSRTANELQLLAWLPKRHGSCVGWWGPMSTLNVALVSIVLTIAHMCWKLRS